MHMFLTYLTDYPPPEINTYFFNVKPTHSGVTTLLLLPCNSSYEAIKYNQILSFSNVPLVIEHNISILRLVLVSETYRLMTQVNCARSSIQWVNWKDQKERMGYLKYLQITG